VSADEQRRSAEAQAELAAELQTENRQLRQVIATLEDVLAVVGVDLPRLGQPAEARPCRVPPPLRRCRPGGRRLR
jgi:hypothetical protein